MKKTLRGAIVGYGFISSKGHMPAYLERMKKEGDVEIIAICDSCLDRKKDLPDRMPFFTDYEKLFSANLDLDFIDVSTHAADHHKIAKRALELGMHVLCEKPLTTSIEEADDLLKTAVKHQRVIFPCHNYKHAPVVKAIREIISNGKIGKVKAVTLNTFRNTHAIGVKDWFPDWRRHYELSGGGIAMDHGSHSLYLTFEWLGGYPKAVSASAQNFSKHKYDTEDNFSALYEFDEGIANLYLTWTAGVRKVIYTIQGEYGAITVDDDQIQVSRMACNDSDSISHKAEWRTETFSITSDWMDSSHTTWFNSMFNKFKTAIEQKDIMNAEIKDAYYCIQSIMKAYESIGNNSAKTSIENNLFN